MNSHVFRDIQELELTVLDYIIRNCKGKEIKPFAKGPYLENWGGYSPKYLQMCVRRNPRTTSHPEVVVFLEEWGVHRYNYRPDSVFVKMLTSEIKRIGATLETCTEKEWKELLSKAEEIVRRA